LTRYFYYF